MNHEHAPLRDAHNERSPDRGGTVSQRRGESKEGTDKDINEWQNHQSDQ